MTKSDKLVASLLQRYSVTQPPVPIEKIATGEGAAIARNAFDGPQSGFALRSASGEKVIGVNAANSDLRQRFTIAHELGHLLLHEGDLILDYAVRTHFRGDNVRVNFRDHESSLATNSEEIEANRFAAEILMPRDMIFREARKLLQAEDLSQAAFTKKLADVFKVSAEAMGYRLVNLTILVP